MSRVVNILIGAFILLSSCSSPTPAPVLDSAHVGPTPNITTAKDESTGDALLRAQKQKLADIQREYENCKDLGDYARMIKLARARRAELDVVIERVHKMKLDPEEHERILKPLRDERDWHLEVIQVASAM